MKPIENHSLIFYFFPPSNFLPESSLKYELLGLNLLWLLTQNRVAEFHTELELLSPKDIQNNVFIHYPVSVEQYLMEGCYNKVIKCSNGLCNLLIFISTTFLHRFSLQGVRCRLRASATSSIFWSTQFETRLPLVWKNLSIKFT